MQLTRLAHTAAGRWITIVLAATLAAFGLTVMGVATDVSPAAAAAPAHPPVVVSLTYDDGTADQYQAGSLMAKYGLHGTFYVNSGRMGASGYMTTADLLDLQASGNEIGGHTVSHADLPTLVPDEATRQVCNDRVNLLGAGLNIQSLAYPYGDTSSAVNDIAARCGYNSARGVGDIVSPGTCHGCAYAEQIPPVDPYEIDTPDSIKPATTLEDMQNYVLQAEQHGGGWVVLVMHHICDNCNPYSVPAQELDSFFSWLAPRSGSGTTVQTVAQVMGGTQKPAVNGPPPPAPLSTTNMLRNPSMEQVNASTGIPVCWQRGGYGTNSFAWSNPADAQDGARAQRVAVTSFTDGDRKMITPQDLGACAPSTVVGHTYQVHGWYKTDGNVRLVAYYRTPAGGWVFLGQGPVLPTSPSGYAQASWVTPAMPAGSTALSIGFSLRSVGFLQGDNMQLNDTDQTPPAVTFTSPDDGGRVRGTVTFTATATDASGVDRVEFLVDGTVACTATAAPYSCTYDTTSKSDSVIAVTARAVDTAGNIALSGGRNYTVSNSVPLDTTPPTVSVSAPTDGANVNQTVTLTASAADNDAVNQVLFYVNGVQVGATNKEPYQVSWDSRTVHDGPVTLSAKALDVSGNLTTSDPVAIRVGNDSLDTTAPSSAITCNGAACGTGWSKQAVTVALSASDPNGSGVRTVVYTTDGSDPSDTNGTTYSAPFSLTQSATVKFRATDYAGNVEAVQSKALAIDTVAPTAAVSAPADRATVTGTTYIVASTADNVSVDRVWFYLDGKALGSRIVTPLQWKWDTTTATKGSHTLYVIASDPAGNQTRSATITVTVS